MERKQTLVVVAAAITLAAMFVISINKSVAQEKAANFSHVIAIDGGQGTIRFFDTISGRLYTYDRTLQKVIRIVELKELGEPATIIRDTAESDDRYVNPRESRQ